MDVTQSLEPLIEKMKAQRRPANECALIRRAYEFAASAHRGQKRKSGDPYIIHPLATAERLIEMRLDTPTVAAALLHDVCEDTDCAPDTIAKNFGDEIAFLVKGVTKVDRIKYKGTERSAESLRQMFLAIAEDIRIILIKLVDRLHNMETLQHLPSAKQKRIALETLEIYAPLSYRLGIKELSGRLEDLAFPYVYPQEHAWLMKTTKEKYEDWDRYIAAVKPVVAEALKRENIPVADIHARAKRYYSLYRKLLKYDMDITKINDIVALRIVVPSIEDCYMTLGAVHHLWRPLPGRIKDYIALPKDNGYRSLHTTVFGPGERLLEIQIRTIEMHEESERGIAAHWAYAEFKRQKSADYAASKTAPIDNKRFAWIRQLQEWQKEFSNPEEFLEALKIDFFKNRIFVLTPKGDVINLPEGATPVDVAYEIHTDIGNAAVGAKVNGKMIALNHELKTGDIVEILTQKNKKPSASWLQFVKSAHARKRIASSIKKITEELQFQSKKAELVEFRVTFRDRIGMLRDISNVFVRSKINIKHVVNDSKHRALPVLVVLAPIKSRPELERLLMKIKEVKGVEEVGYKLL